MEKKYSGALLVLLSSFLYASYGIWSVLLKGEFGIFFQEYVRSIIVLLVLIPIAYHTKIWKKIEKEDRKYFFVVSFFGLCTQVPLYYAYQHAGVGIVTLILFGSSLLTSFIFGKMLFYEKITKIKIFAFVISCIGLYLVFINSFGRYSLLALFMAVLGGIAFAGETSFSKLIPDKFSVVQISIIPWIFSVIVYLPVSIIVGEKQLVPNFSVSWLIMFVFAIISLLAYYFVLAGFKKIEASIGGLISTSEVVFGVIFGVLIFKEQISFNIIIGGILIFISVLLPHLELFQDKCSNKHCQN